MQKASGIIEFINKISVINHSSLLHAKRGEDYGKARKEGVGEGAEDFCSLPSKLTTQIVRTLDFFLSQNQQHTINHLPPTTSVLFMCESVSIYVITLITERS